MELYSLPFQDGHLIYRPLLGIAFAGNAAMVNLLTRLQDGPVAPRSSAENRALSLLEAAGFLRPDPEPEREPARRAPYRPTVAVLCMTTACNLRCVYCYACGGETAPRHLPVELGRRAIDTVCRNARDSGAEHFRLEFHGGGEPTLAALSLRALVAHARTRESPCQVSVTTNGCWTKATRKWLLAHVDHVSLSLDGTREVQNRQRPDAGGGATFRRVLESARALDQHGVSYGIRMTVTDDSIAHLPAGIELLTRRTCCGVFQAEPAFDCGRARDAGLSLSLHQRFAEAFLEAWDIAASRGRHLYYSGARPGIITRRFCGAASKALIVTPEGSLTACYEVCSPDHPLAGMFFMGKLGPLGPRTEEHARRSFEDALYRSRARCAGCFCYWHCAGDCPSKVLAADGFTAPPWSPRCELNRLITRELLVRYAHAAGGVWRLSAQPHAAPHVEGNCR